MSTIASGLAVAPALITVAALGSSAVDADTQSSDPDTSGAFVGVGSGALDGDGNGPPLELLSRTLVGVLANDPVADYALTMMPTTASEGQRCRVGATKHRG